MKNKKFVQSVVACLLHDIGKVSGSEVSTPTETDDHIVWIVDKADNIAAGVDRRDDYTDTDDVQLDKTRPNWQKNITLRDVFNVFGEKPAERYYRPQVLNDERKLGFPAGGNTSDLTDTDYEAILKKVENTLQAIDFSSEGAVQSILNLLEVTCAFIPSSTNANEVADISLYDHSKLTAAFGSCIYHYAYENKKFDNLRSWTHSPDFNTELIFQLASFDISGIQDFIYTIVDAGATKQLRARSFYLEMITEHLADELLRVCGAEIGLTRANCLYLGGGHAYFILPNTNSATEGLKHFEQSANEFFLEAFGTALYIATGSMAFSASVVVQKFRETNEDVKARTDAYTGLYRSVSEQISDKKLHRYTAEQIKKLNSREVTDGRECIVCHRVGQNSQADKCKVCSGLEELSKYVLNDPRGKNNGYFIVTDNPKEKVLSVGFGKYLDFVGGQYQAIEDVKTALENGDNFKVYLKNKFTIGEVQGPIMLVGDYACRNSNVNPDEIDGNKGLVSFEGFAREAGGIARVACLRMDVDDLGAAFMSGFSKQGNPQGVFNTMSRSATFSRNMGLFFKYYLNWLLQNPHDGSLTDRSAQEIKGQYNGRKCQIIYSGGDDVFIVGAWDDIIEFALDLRASFKDYTNGKLTLSAGVGLFPKKYPVSQMAKQTGRLEDAAKSHSEEGVDGGKEKDSIALFTPEYTFKWNTFSDQVLGQKYRTVKEFFELTGMSGEYGKAFIYKLLGLLRETQSTHVDQHKTISMAHWVYFLMRMEPKSDDKLGEFRKFTNKLYEWIGEANDRKQLQVALELYVYTIRNDDKKEEDK
ncbi:MAG: type III-A CRISPR-associated protein Cas10/Csm1 [Candidatus Ancillula sp.]|nr:type III-A CRISPR-associated protein Cas10/Csm1 [Candidatus Ancillula sp.]